MFEVNQRDSLEPPKHVLIANAHLHWDPDFCDIKLLQTILLSNGIHRMRVAAVTDQDDPARTNKTSQSSSNKPNLNDIIENEEAEEDNNRSSPNFCKYDWDKPMIGGGIPALVGQSPESIPVIVAGDFNSLPKSGVVEFMESGKVGLNHNDWLEYEYNKCFMNLSQQNY